MDAVRERRWSFAALMSGVALILNCQPPVEPEVVPLVSAPADQDPVIATVGGVSLLKAQVPELARMAQSVRSAAGVEVDAKPLLGNELSRALETLALASAVQTGVDGIDAEGQEEYQRLLARLLLKRVVEKSGDGPISDEEIRRAYEAEIEQYQKTGQSELLNPTRIDAMTIVIGLFPDAHIPARDEVPLVSPREALALSREFREVLGDRVTDLDRFLAQAREFTAGHPTVQVQELSGITLDRRLSSVDARIHTALVALDGNGAISEPIEFEGGVYLIRRGYTSPGAGERPEEIRSQLEVKIRTLRRQEAFQRLRTALLKRYRVQTWPERLNDTRGGKPQP
jgi:hypothetical protein